MPSRRSLLKAAVFPAIAPTSVFAKPAPSDKLTFAVIGTGNNGTNWMKHFLAEERCRVVAVCDVNREGGGYWDGTVRGREPARRLVDETYGDASCKAYSDYREILARPDIDGIYIGTPDHWHAKIAIEGAAAKKHIYGQKPLATTVAEGRRMVRAVERAGIVWQTGSQQRSDPYFRRACKLVRTGFVGKLHTVRVGLPGGTPDYGKVADKTATEPVPEGFDYQTWLGPAPFRPFCPARVGVNFRWVRDYSGGQLTDWGAHHIDMAHWAMDRDSGGPVAIKNAKGVFADGPIYDTATEFSFEAHYPDGVRIVVSSEGKTGVRFEGSDGWLWVNRGGRWESHDEKALQDEKRRLGKATEAVGHVKNFLDAVLDGATPVAPIETAQRSVTVAHLGNIAMLVGRDLSWDAAEERFVNDAEADRMLDRRYRPPWTV